MRNSGHNFKLFDYIIVIHRSTIPSHYAVIMTHYDERLIAFVRLTLMNGTHTNVHTNVHRFTVAHEEILEQCPGLTQVHDEDSGSDRLEVIIPPHGEEVWVVHCSLHLCFSS